MANIATLSTTDTTCIQDSTEYYIYVSAFWHGFIDKTDANNIDIFEKLFSKTIIRNFKITNDLEKANVLFESVFGSTLADIKEWKYKIFFSGEPYISNPDKYDLLLYSTETKGKIVDLPLYVAYIYNNNFLDRIINKPKITKIPEKFCCFIVSNDVCETRNRMFHYLNQYKKVDSGGKYCNNIGYVIKENYWTDEFRAFISNYKFIICFENNKVATYSTEKIVNPYMAGSIPIYWSSAHIHNVFNKDSMLFLKDESMESYKKLINEIIELDNNDDKYLEFVNRPAFNEDMAYFNNNYNMDAIASKIDNVLLKKLIE
jgi:hypothetical protein